MAAITDVTLTAGVPTAGTGTVTTLDKFNGTAGSSTTQALTVQGIASGTAVPVSVASVPSHAVTNAGTFAVQNNAATPAGTNLIGKADIQVAGTAPAVGAGAANAATLRVTMDSGQLGTLGQTTMSASVPVTVASNQSAVPVSNTPLTNFGAGEYETVAASQTAQALGATGATGDYISGLLVIPATTSPGNVLLLDNATSITVFTGGATSVSSLVPFFIPLGMISVSGAWKVTTGANVSVIGIGNFT